MLARNRAGTIKIILVLFYETSLHTQKKFFAKLFNLWFALTLSRRFTKCLEAMCSQIQPSYADTLNYIRQVSRTITMLFNQYFSGQVMNSNIGLEVYSQWSERSCGRGDGEPLEFRNDFLIPDYFQLNFRLRG